MVSLPPFSAPSKPAAGPRFGLNTPDAAPSSETPETPAATDVSPPSAYDILVRNPLSFAKRRRRREVTGLDAMIEGCSTLVTEPMRLLSRTLKSTLQPTPARSSYAAQTRTTTASPAASAASPYEAPLSLADYDPILFDALTQRCADLGLYKITRSHVDKLAADLGVSKEQMRRLAQGFGFMGNKPVPADIDLDPAEVARSMADTDALLTEMGGLLAPTAQQSDKAEPARQRRDTGAVLGDIDALLAGGAPAESAAEETP